MKKTMKLLLITLVLVSTSFCMIEDHIKQLRNMNAQMRTMNNNLRSFRNNSYGLRRLSQSANLIKIPLKIGAQVNYIVRNLAES